MNSWLNPHLSLQTEIHQERDRRAAVRLTHHELQQLTDSLIVQWYRQQKIIDCCLRRVRSLEVQLMLAQSSGTSTAGPSAEHLQMAREVLATAAGQGTP
jgi:hypothetical protein